MSSQFGAWLNEVARRWQEAWDKAGIFNAEPSQDRKKFFLTAAFPYTNQPLDFYYARLFVTADVYARYLRGKGYNVLFPFAFQYTGTPIISVSDAIRRGDRDVIERFVNQYGISEEEVKKFADPMYMARYFHNRMKEAVKALGLSVDWRREFTTVDPAFEKFVQWQYRKLMQRGLLKQEDAPVAYCPVDNFPVGMHDTKGDIEPEISDFDAVYFDSGDFSFLAAFPRPETVFGVIAVMVHPDAEYVIAQIGNRKAVVSREAFERLKYQKEMRELKSLKGKELEGLYAYNAITGKQVPVIASRYVSPRQGTGVVGAVPSHEPEHFLALTELGREFELVPVIRTEGLAEIPGPQIIDLAQTTNPQELRDYIDTLYNLEYHKGYMREDVVERVRDFLRPIVREMIAGKPVREARKAVVGILRNLGAHELFYQIVNGPVYCRCGAEVVVKTMKGQWFVDYSNPMWKAAAMKAAERVKVVPDSMRRDLQRYIFEAKPRALTRTRGLGVRLPWDDRQIIDQLSDSTIYMAFYTVSHRLKYPPSSLNDAFWDYVILGEGDVNEVSNATGISKQELMSLREEVAHWYPLDSRLAGRPLVRNHLPYMIYHHVALFGEAMVPREIVMTGFVRPTRGQRKEVSLEQAIQAYGSDAVRLSLLYTNEVAGDLDLEIVTARKLGETLRKVHDFVSYLLSLKGTNQVREADLWLSSYMNSLVKEVLEDYEAFRFKPVIDKLLFELPDKLRDYLALVDFPNSDLLNRVVSAWIRLLAPLAPHVAEEAWHAFKDSFVSLEPLPKPEEFQFDLKAFAELEYVNYLADVIEDLKSGLSESPERIILFVSTDERKVRIVKEAIKAVMERKTLRDFVLGHEEEAELYRRAFEAANRLPDSIKRLINQVEFNEAEVIAKYAELLIKKLGLEEVKIYDADDPATPNLKGKKDIAMPFAPGVFLVVPR
ncbi:MAG: leucine--tRNA ligase [Thermoprotei archaeon]